MLLYFLSVFHTADDVFLFIFLPDTEPRTFLHLRYDDLAEIKLLLCMEKGKLELCTWLRGKSRSQNHTHKKQQNSMKHESKRSNHKFKTLCNFVFLLA